MIAACWGVGPSPLTAELVQADEAVGWKQQGDWVWRYAFGANAALPSLDVLRIPGGSPLLAHPGIRFRWSRINGVNFGGEQATAPSVRVTWRNPIVEALPDGGVVIRQRIDYLDSTGRREIAEYRDLVFSEVGRNGRYSVDWTSHFTAGEAGALLEDGNDGTSGLTFVLDGGRDPMEIVLLPATLNTDAAKTSTQGLATVMYPHERHPGSIAILADPRSTVGLHQWVFKPEHPQREINAVLLRDGSRRLDAGEVWEISYRFVVRPKQWDVEDLRLEYFRWLGR